MNEFWLCLPDALERYFSDIRVSAEMNTGEYSERSDISPLSSVGRTAYIDITGVLSQNGPGKFASFLGVSGSSYLAISRSVSAAANDSAVDSIVLNISSPGGSVFGLDETWQAIKNASGKKQVIAVGSGVVASAAYYLATAATRIEASSPSTLFGSIGAMLQVSAKNEGVITVVSDNAPNKSPEPGSQEQIDAAKSVVNALERRFFERVSQGRNVSADYIREHFGRGGLLVAKDVGDMPSALFVKMIDAVKGDTTAAGVAAKGVKMTFEEFLAANPQEAVRYQASLQAAREEGVLKERSKAVMLGKIMSDPKYSGNKMIVQKAAQALSGERTMDAFIAFVDFVDMSEEKAASMEASLEQESIPVVESSVEASSIASKVAEKKNEAGIKMASDENELIAEAQRLKALMGEI